jgi:hypothetical protein
MFRKKHDVDCLYCKYGYVLYNETDCLCDKYGFIQRKNKCSKFTYEPLKRIPSPPASTPEFNENDFKLE